MPTTILLLLLAWWSPSSGPSHADPGSLTTASPRLDAESRTPAACLILAQEGQTGWPLHAAAIVEDSGDDDSNDELTLSARLSPRPHRRSPGLSGVISPRVPRHDAGRSRILRC